MTPDVRHEQTGTVRLHRVLRAPPGRVYRAFLDPHAKAKWLPPDGFVAQIEAFDPRVGGGYRMRFVNFATGHAEAFTCTFLELEEPVLLRYTDRFDDPGLPGEMMVEVRLEAVSCGTALHVVQSGIPAAIPEAMCYLGWQESLAQLARLVEPESPDGA